MTPHKSNSEIALKIFNKVRGHDQHDCGGRYDEQSNYECECLGLIKEALDAKDKELESELARLREALKLAEHFVRSDGKSPVLLERINEALAESGEGK